MVAALFESATDRHANPERLSILRKFMMVRSIHLGCFALCLLVANFAQGSLLQQASQPATKLMSPQKERVLRASLPKLADKEFQQVLADPNLIFYTETEMPRAFQQWDGDLQGVHSPWYNISANGSEPFGNGNREFPWGTPAGTHRSSKVTSFRFLLLPRDASGKKPLPVVWFRQRLRGDTSVGYAWRFPVGTIVGEVLQLRCPDGKDYTFELRFRIREREDWAVDVFRPFPTAEDLAERLKQLRPEWAQNPELAKLVKHLESPLAMRELRLRDPHPLNPTLDQRMGVDSLPAIDDAKLVAELLTKTPFKSALAELWRKGSNGTLTSAPTTQAEFHIVPVNYDAGFIEVDKVSCTRCHNTVNQHVDRFEPGRDWYGRVRGSDGIFSFHPFSLETISSNGFGSPVRMRSELVTLGILQKYDPRKHPESAYTSIPHLQE